jgi:serine phosphatase RsbU (regulator of sigma subunit)
MDIPERTPQDIEQIRDEIERCNYHLHTLFDIGKDIFGIMDIELILKNSLLFALGNFGVIEGFIGLFDLASKRATQFISEGYQFADIRALQISAENTLLQKNLKDLAPLDVRCGDHEFLPSSVNCILPFKVDDDNVGLIGLGSKLVDANYSSDEKKLIATLVNNMVVALQNARSFEEIKNLNQDLLENKKKLETTLEKLRVAVRKKAKYSKHLEKIIAALNVAQEVQQSLLPQYSPHQDRFDLAGSSQYCDETGGDYYDYIELPVMGSDVYAIAVGDVSGHGISSALLMASIRAYLRSRVTQAGSVAEIITDVNWLAAADTLETDQFMTLLFLVIEAHSGRLTWVRAGHDPVIVYSPDSDHFDELKGEGLPLGVSQNWIYKDYTATVKPGQILVLTTDGIMETHNEKGAMFGRDRLKAVVRANAGLESEGIRSAIIDAVMKFRGKAPQEDDITLVVLKFS